jgi:DNA-binding winged helix-turn-helix (wHTH) protein/tetratricopeptide (TPR) repeat protein
MMIFAFADVELDVGLYQLRRRGAAVKLAPKAFDLLLYLIQHRDRVVTKSELLKELWPGEHVTESVLPTAVAAIRRALEGKRSTQDLVKTVHARGYRFVALVDERESAEIGSEAGLFVGREAVMQELGKELEEVFSGRGRMLMLAGEPGIGKTRTAEELLREAQRRGAVVAEGRCHEGEGVPAFWPWTQILRALVSNLPGAQLAEQLGAGASDIAPLVPELRSRLHDLPDSVTIDSEQARFRFFDSVSIFLTNMSRARPLVLFLDDLTWADEPSLRLLHFLVRGTRDARLALVGTYRDVELRRQNPLASVLSQLVKEPHFRRIPLRGLTQSDVGRFIADGGRRAPSDELVRAVFDMTEGNLFFVQETVRLLDAEGRFDGDAPETPWSLSLPQGVREVVGRRLDQLSDECNRILGLAAVMGREFTVGILQYVAEVSRDVILDELGQAEAAGIVRDRLGSGAGAKPLPLGHYVFSHALIREALYEELTSLQRVRLHRSIAEALEKNYAGSADSHLPELAHHFFEAAAGGDAERAIDYSVRAGEQALELLAWEEGVAHYERALQVDALAVPSEDARRGKLTVGLGQALWRSGDYGRAGQVFGRAIDQAHNSGDGNLLARATLGMGGWPKFRFDEVPGGPADQHRALLEEALSRVGEGETALRALLLSQLADQTSMEMRRSYSEQAVGLARKSGDADALFGALYARLTALLGPDDIRNRSEVARELLDLALRGRSKEKVFVARESRIRSFLALGEMSEADREIESCHELAEELRLPVYRHSVSRFRLARALGDGRFEEVERLNFLVLELGNMADDTGTDFLFDLLKGWLKYARGEPCATRALIDRFGEWASILGPVSWAVAAFLYGEVDDLESARRHFEMLAANGFDELPRDENWLFTLAFASQACACLGDRKRAVILYHLLLPYADLVVSHAHLRAYIGSVESVLAGLAATLGQRDQAAVHYEAAVESERRMGVRPQLARTEYAYARMLLGGESTSPADRRRARGLLASAEKTAQDLGLRRMLEVAQELCA